MTTFSRVCALMLGAVVTINVGVFAATSFDININATSSAARNLSVEAADYSVSNLGTSAISATTFGTMSINDNGSTGFKVIVRSQNGGKLLLAGVPDAANNSIHNIPYVISFQEAGGTLATGLTGPSLGATFLSTDRTLAFTGAATSATSAYTLNMKFATDAKFIAPGTYSDTLMVSVEDN